MAEDKEQAIIIKKYKKKGEEGHGGSWKVAYADFVTAMMAFFLLMWLLNMTSPQKKIALSEYFQNYSIFEKGGGAAVGGKQDVPGKGQLDEGRGKSTSSPEIAATQLAEKLKNQIDQTLKEYKDRVIVMDDKGNVRIEIIDTEGQSFYPLGGTELNEGGKLIIQELSQVLKELNKKLIIEGHTDSLAYSGNKYTNWELSTQRASAARVELEKNGIKSAQIEIVSGYAETKPFVKENPADPKNRRISIVVDYRGESVSSAQPKQPAGRVGMPPQEPQNRIVSPLPPSPPIPPPKSP
jgi:chemotaxis protein MotB